MHPIINAVPNLSVITRIEIMGFNSPDADLISDFVASSVVYDLTEAVILQTIALRKTRRIKLPDAIIAATALVHGLKLITQNASDFAGIKGLSVINPHRLYSALPPTMTLIPYDNYKDSGIDWLGSIPDHWEIKRVKDIFKYFGSGTTPKSSNEDFYEDGDINWLNTTDLNNGYITATKNKISKAAFEQCSLKLYPENALAIAMYGQGKTRGTVGLFKIKTTTNQASCVMYKSFIANEKYMLWWFIHKYEGIRAINIGATQPNMNQDFVKFLLLQLPPLAEQTVIANYLDQQTAAIDKKTSIMQQRIATFQALRKSIINETVCRGLDKTAPLKNSGIDWIGEIPTHWAVQKLKDITTLRFSNVDKNEREDHKQVLLCNYVDVYKNDFITSSLSFMKSSASEAEIKRFALRKGDIIITKDSETHDDIGVPALVIQDLENVVCGYHLALIRLKAVKASSSYIFYLFKSGAFNYGFAIQAKGITRVGLSINSIADALLLLPPLAEQTAIASYIDEKTATIDAIVANLNAQLMTLAELRKTLINDVVTGRIRVV